MERRDFLKKTAFVMATATLAPAALSAAGSEFSPQAPQGNVNDYKIISDTVKNGIRYVSATQSAKVCSKQIDIEIDVKTQTIRNCAFTRGCPGNAIGLCNMIKGQKVSTVIEKLSNVPCASRGTSCPDQLAKILKSLK